MKRKLPSIALVAVLLITSITAGEVAGKVVPHPGEPGWFGSPAPANASSLSVEPKAPIAPLTPTGTGFTYQGSLKSGGNPAGGSYDLVFTLYDAASAGNVVSSPITLTNQTVTGGLFTVSLDFGSSAFDGNARYLEIAVRQSGGGSYTTLSPRQPITPAPYALFALKTQPYKNVVTVAQSGGQFTSVSAALASITDNSTNNRYLIKVAPGTYTETVTMKQWVDIEGSGEKTTKITFTGSAALTTATVAGANNAELRSLTVENTGSAIDAVAMYNNGTSPSLSNVTITAFGGSSNNFGMFNDAGSSPPMNNVTASASGLAGTDYTVCNQNGSSPNMNNVTATASGATYDAGVYNYNSSPTMTNLTASASGGSVSNYGVADVIGGSVSIYNSKITGATNALFNGSGTTTRVSASRLSGGPVSNAGTITCSASFDGNNTRLGSQCTPDTKVVYAATTGGDYTSIQAALNSIADNSSTNRYLVKVGPGTFTEQVTMKPWVDIEGSGEGGTKITFTGSASDGTGTVVGANNAELRSLAVENTGSNANAIAIYNNTASPSLRNITATAIGGTATSIGVYNYSSSSPNMVNVTITASGAPSWNYGVLDRVSASPNMVNVTSTASGTGSALVYGVGNETGSSPHIVSSNISGTGSTYSYGVASSSGGTVTIDNSKISGTTASVYNDPTTTTKVGASQLSGGPVSNAGTLTCSASYDGSNERLGSFCTPDTKVVYVATTGGDFTSIRAALNSITDNSSTNHYLIRVGPGTYSERVTMKPYVDIEGSGEGNTKITFTGSSSFDAGTVVGASNAELRSLTVENTGGSPDFAVAIYNNAASPSLLHVTAVVSSASTTSTGVFNDNSSSPNMTDMTVTASGNTASNSNRAVVNIASSPNMTNITITVSGNTAANFGVVNASSSPNMTNVSITASGASQENEGIANSSGGTVKINNSRIIASYPIYNAGSTTQVSTSQLVGTAFNYSGSLTCIVSYDGNNKRLGADCTRNTKTAIVGLTDGDYNSITAALADVATWCGTPSSTNKCLVHIGPGTYSERVTMLQYVDIEGSGEQNTKITFTGSASLNTGTVLGASNAELRFLTVENTGGNLDAIAIYNSSASPSLVHITASSLGAIDNSHAIDNQNSSPNMINVTATASGTSSVNTGVYNNSSSPNMTNVTATGTGGAGSLNHGVVNINSSPRIVNCIITASGTNSDGVNSNGPGNVTIDDSKVSGTAHSVSNGVGTFTRVGASQMSGGAVLNSGTLSCAGVYDENYLFFASTCP